MIYVYLREPV